MIQQHSSDSTPLSEDNAGVDESCSKENDDNNSVDSEGAKNENNVFDDMLETLLQPLSRSFRQQDFPRLMLIYSPQVPF